MPYVYRDGVGAVSGTSDWPPAGEPVEFLPGDHPEAVAFLNPPPPADADMAEAQLRSSKAFLALCRHVMANDLLTEDEMVTLLRARLP